MFKAVVCVLAALSVAAYSVIEGLILYSVDIDIEVNLGILGGASPRRNAV